MDPKMFEINNLRVLNDYLNQTIEVLTRAQRTGTVPALGGFTHSPYAVGPIAANPYVPTMTVDPSYAATALWAHSVQGLTHSPYTAPLAAAPFATPGAFANTPFAAVPYATQPFAASSVIDPFVAQRGLSHSPFAVNPWTTTTAITGELARQQQLTHAIAARQQVLEAICRSCGIPV